RRDPEELRELLDASLPRGLDVVDAVEARTSGFAERLVASAWELRLPRVAPEEAADAVAAFLAAESVEVRRQTKKGMRTFDARAAVVALESVAHSAVDDVEAGAPVGSDGPAGVPCAILRLVVRHVTPAVRPDDVLSG